MLHAVRYLYYNSPLKVCLSKLANCRSQFLLDRLGRCLKLFVSTESITCHEFASQFVLAIFLCAKNTQNYREYQSPCPNVYLNEAPTGYSGEYGALTSSCLGAHRPIEQRQPGWRRRWVAVYASVCVYACVRA